MCLDPDKEHHVHDIGTADHHHHEGGDEDKNSLNQSALISGMFGENPSTKFSRYEKKAAVYLNNWMKKVEMVSKCNDDKA